MYIGFVDIFSIDLKKLFSVSECKIDLDSLSIQTFIGKNDVVT